MDENAFIKSDNVSIYSLAWDNVHNIMMKLKLRKKQYI